MNLGKSVCRPCVKDQQGFALVKCYLQEAYRRESGIKSKPRFSTPSDLLFYTVKSRKTRSKLCFSTTRLVKKLTTHLCLVEDIAARISRGTATFESRLVGRSSTYQARNHKAKKPRTTGYTQSFVVWWKLGRDVMNIHGSSAREVTLEVSHDHLGNSRHTFL